MGVGTAVLLAACSDGDATGPQPPPDTSVEVSCAAFVAVLTRCDLLTGTRFVGCSDDDPQLACMSACLEEASCEQIAAAYCEHAFNGFGGCLNECNMAAMVPQFTCGD